jgi:hypothetical protein
VSIEVKKSIWDYGINANMDASSNLTVYENEEAVNNALLTYFMTGEGEILNQPNLGGELLPYQFKEISIETYRNLNFFIKTKIYTEFFPVVKILDLKTIPDFDNKSWDITIKYYIEQFQIEQVLETQLKRVQLRAQEYEVKYINLTGQTLYNFVITYLYDLYSVGIKWNGTYFQWGERFLFTALTPEDPYYDKIMEGTNSNRSTVPIV